MDVVAVQPLSIQFMEAELEATGEDNSMEDCEEVISTEAPSNSTEASTELPTTPARVVVPTKATTATRVVDNEETTCLPCEHINVLQGGKYIQYKLPGDKVVCN